MKYNLLLLLLAFTGSIKAQKNDSVSRNGLTFRVSFGMISDQNFHLSANQWNARFSEMQLPSSQENFVSDHGGRLLGSTGYLNLGLEIPVLQFGNKSQILTRVSFGIGPSTRVRNTWFQESTGDVLDTLHSAVLQTDTYVYEKKTEIYSTSTDVNSFVVGTGLYFSTSKDRIFAFQTGLSLRYALGVVGEQLGTHSTFYTTNISNDNGSPYDSYLPPNQYDEQRVTYHKNVHQVLFQVPFDFNFRLGRKQNLASRLRLGFEFTPGVNYTVYDGKTAVIPVFNHGFSLRYQFRS